MPYKDPRKKQAMLARVRPPTGRLPLYANSRPHVALLYLKMRRGPVHTDELVTLNPHMFKNIRTDDTMRKLTQKGFITKVRANIYRITPRGIAAIYQMSNRRATDRKGRITEDDVD